MVGTAHPRRMCCVMTFEKSEEIALKILEVCIKRVLLCERIPNMFARSIDFPGPRSRSVRAKLLFQVSKFERRKTRFVESFQHPRRSIQVHGVIKVDFWLFSRQKKVLS